jgi:thiol-disulfide isomerase/thioredoxin
MSVPEREFTTIDGEQIKIGGIQDKPTVINLWFIRCGGCVAEIPALNRLYKKYKNKINFIALTFDDEKEVSVFLQKQAFNFKHIASKNQKDKKLNVEPFINTIESYPYPENIFIDRFGTIQYIEGGLGNMDNLDLAIKHFELIIQDLLPYKTDDANSLIEEK